MKKKFLSKNIAILSLSYLGADYAYASSACPQNDANPPAFVCSGADEQSHFFESQDNNPISVILNEDYLNTINDYQPIFNIISNTGVSFEQKAGSELKNLSGDGIVISSTDKGEINLIISGNITANGVGINAYNEGDNSANVQLDIAGKIVSNSTNIESVNYAPVGPATTSINIQENAELLSSEDSEYGLGVYVNNNSYSDDAIVSVTNAGTIHSSSHGVNVHNISSNENATAITKFELTDSGKIISDDGVGVNINNWSNKTAEIIVDIAGNILSNAQALGIDNSGAGADIDSSANASVTVNIAESAMISSNEEGMQLRNFSGKEAILNLNIAGNIQSNNQVIEISNFSNNENGKSISNIYIDKNATISSQNSAAITLYNSAYGEAKSTLMIKGRVIAGDQYAIDVTNQGEEGAAKINLVLEQSAEVVSQGGAGIRLNNSSTNSANINMAVAGNISSVADAIYIYNNTRNQDASSKVKLDIAESANISSTGSSAMSITNNKDINVTVNGSAIGTTGIYINGGMNGEYNETANIHVGGKVTGTDGIAIDLSNYIGESATLSLAAGWDIKGQVLASGSRDNNLVLTGNETSSLDLNLIGNEQDQNGILGFNHFVKEGSSIWHLTNSLEQNNGFDSAKITSGGVILDNASFAMNDSANNPFTIESSATLYNSGNSSILGDVYNSGVISFSNPLMDKRFISDQSGTLTIDGNYHGNDGYLVINTELADDTAQTDKLVITGDTSGNTQVVVNNRGGIGAQTENGIEIIEVNGISDSDAFSLAGDYTLASGESAIVAGAYAYTLQQHDLTTGSDGNWYLRSTQLGANTPMHEVYPRVLLALNGLPTLKQRTGGRYLQDTPVSQYASYLDAYQAEQADTRDLWVRMDREYIKFNPEQSATESAYDINTFNLQMGYDGFKRQTDKGTLIAGVNVHIGRAQANTTSYFGDGRIHSNAYGFGFNGTWYNKDGYYLDAQSKFNWLRSDLTSKETHTTLEKNNNGFGYAFGIESGKRISLDDSWTLIPQAQLVWSSVNFNQFKDIYDAEVSINKGDSLQARLGLAIENQTSWQNQNGELSHRNLYGIVNFYTELMDETKITVDDVSLINKSDRNWVELGLGMNYGWNNNRYNAFVELSSRSSLKDFADTYAVKGTVGIKVNF